MHDGIFRLMFDGGIQGGNPGGILNYGWVLFDDENQEIASGKWSDTEARPTSTNNVSEYMGVLNGLRYVAAAIDSLIELGLEKLLVNGDSQLIIRQITGMWSCRVAHLRQLRAECLIEIETIKSHEVDCEIQWVPREVNFRADELGRIASGEMLVEKLK